MTEKDIAQNIKDFEVEHLEWMKDHLLKEGTAGPLIALLTLKIETDTMGLVIAPIIGDFQGHDKGEIIEKILPELNKQMKEDGLIPYCFSFASEAYMRTVPAEDIKDIKNPIPDDWKKYNKIDTLMVTFESRDTASTHVFTTEVVGKAINEDGRMIDSVKLTPFKLGTGKEKVGGVLTGLFKKYFDE